MAVDNKDVIDAISISPAGKTVLTISDHLDWDKCNHHLVILQEKINAYLLFLESEQLYESYPDAINRELEIQIVFKYLPPNEAVFFLDQVENILTESGYDLLYFQLADIS